MPDNNARLDARLAKFTAVAPSIEGWLNPRMAVVVKAMTQFHLERNVHGSVMEIGVHHGLFFLLLNAVRRPEEIAVAMDIFERQDLNVDHSGLGSRETFERNFDRTDEAERDKLVVLPGDSMAMPGSELRRLSDGKGYRAISIDGGHTAMHAFSDLCLAQDVVAPGGFVYLDDFFGPLWPGVTEGYFRYMSVANRKLAPVLLFGNKLVLTTFSEHQVTLDYLARVLGESLMKQGLWSFIKLGDFAALANAG